uniref:Uncharacterized protein n=1 Tax=Meloidogyne floridensis TaxID=298350 RepID=A0A915P875_9BILA
MILLNLRTFLELYKPLSQKLGYFDREYDEKITTIIDKIQLCINDHKDCINRTIKFNYRWKYINKVDKFESGWNEIIKKFVEDKIGIEIVKVSIIEGLQYIGVDIEMFEALEKEGKRYKTKMLTEEVS